ncbi:MAG: hypothetical protein ACK59A_08215 [Cyanobacteriota bacterium]
MILPIEFGFDTRLSKNVRRGVLDTNGMEIGNQSYQESDSGKLVGKTIFISQVPPTDTQGIILRRLPDESPKNIIEKYLQPTRLSASFIHGTSSLQELSKIVPNRFAVGSLRNVVRIRVDDKDIQADTPLNDPRFSMTAYFAYGSCPYLMVYNSDKGYWEELGTVIAGRQSKAEESYGVYRLGDHPQKFKIEERDMEVSYLNSISILYDDMKSGEEYELKTKIPELAANDESYYVLHQNEALVINLKSLLPKDSVNVRVKIQGFYNVLSGVGPQNSRLPDGAPVEGGIGS